MSAKDEVVYACETLGYAISDSDADAVAEKLENARISFGEARGSLFPGGGAVLPFVKQRMKEMGILPCCSGKCNDSFFVVGRFHFFRICESAKGWVDPGFEKASQLAGVKRSPLSRLSSASPINETARKIAGCGDRPCPYCNRYFRNPAAMAMHIQENHMQLVKQ